MFPTSRWFVGASVGSGGEGVDLALVEVTGLGLNLTARIVRSLRMPFSRDLTERFDRVHRNSAGTWHDLASVHRQVPEVAAGGVLQLLQQSKIDWSQIVALGWLGPLLWHEPDGNGTSTTFETGMAGVLAERTGLTVVSDFRSRDVIVGGQGLPITALADWLLFRHPDEERVLIHLGAVSSVVFLPRSLRVNDVVALEAGPCNRWLDGLIHHWTAGRERFDSGGRHAVQGRCVPEVLTRWLAHPFFARRPPKSLGRGEFIGEFLIHAGEQLRACDGSLQDLLCTASHLVVRTISDVVERWLPVTDGSRRFMLTGGGVRNGMLLRLIAEKMPITKSEECDVPIRGRNAACAAILTTLAVDGVPANSPTLTGATGGRLLGHFTPGSSRNWAKCVQAMSQQLIDLVAYREAG